MAKREIERRYAGRVEFRASGDGASSPGTLVGYASVFGRSSEDLGGFTERVGATAFNKTLADGGRVMARYNHSALLGATDSGTLRLSTDEVGLRYEVDLPDTSTGRDVAALAARGDLHASSFAFRTIRDTWSPDYVLRTLDEVQLVDVAPVDTPAYPDATVALRSREEARAAVEPPARPFAPPPPPTGEGEERGVPLSVLRLQMELEALR